MRDILFRGQSIDRRKWYEGDLYQTRLKSVFYIQYYTEYGDRMAVEVDPETVGQYTGITDKNGRMIFEGDVVLFPWGEKREVFSVEFVEGEFEAIPKRKSTDIWCIRIGSYAPEFEVIGNIHDNPELLEGGER